MDLEKQIKCLKAYWDEYNEYWDSKQDRKFLISKEQYRELLDWLEELERFGEVL